MNWRGVAITGLVLVAGCNGIALGDGTRSPTETVTPVPVGTVEETQSAATPPGVSMDGALDLNAIVASHHAHVTERIDSYTWVARAERRVEGWNGSDRNYSRSLRKDGDVFLVEHRHEDGRNITLYASGTTGYLRTIPPARTELRVVDQPRPHTQYTFAEEMIRQFLRQEGTSVRRIERDGEVFYRLHAGRPGSQMGSASLRETISNYAATAYVTPRGFVRTMVVDYERAVEGTTRHTYLRFDYSTVGETSVDRPDWVDRALTETPVPETPTATPATPGAEPTPSTAPVNATTSGPVG